MSCSKTYLTDHPCRQGDPNPTSAKQIRANQQNAQLSTGPRTPEGKAISSLNAIKHGLYARGILISSKLHTEDPDEYLAFVQALFEELQPETPFQEHLVRKIANCIWRSRRALVAETAYINQQLSELADVIEEENEPNDPTDPASAAPVSDPPELGPTTETAEEIDESTANRIRNQIGTTLVPPTSFGHNIAWYEMRLDRQLSRAYILLNLLKNRPLRPVIADSL
jgi:hypothetical protein